ncbi:penicillin-binding protein 2, partial [candidate division KSB1 bacterium]|nr:penicillin-binding protein 2 [candidate division KSB1 bacterium]
GLIDLEEPVTCYGSYRLGRRQFKCWKEKGHGEVNLLDAIQQSCNVYFYKKGLDVGLANWSKFSRFFRFGSKTGIDLPNEGSGLVPDAVYFDAKYGVKKWTRGLTLNLAVGQGELRTTPLQMAYFAMIVGNEGTAFRPHLVRKIEDPNTGESIEPGRERRQIVGISKSTYRTIKQGMYLVVNGPHGTGRASWVRGLNVCGKTGTAQNPHGNSHAWFIGFAPKDNPKIAFCVMVENGGGGGAVAAPIARGILTTYFRDNQLALGQ